uniref:Uncharacterized protein n=1 Tax=Cynoglossus semilaevis TaxID=244447 RepID=A0A3P8VJ65_CYNSE
MRVEVPLSQNKKNKTNENDIWTVVLINLIIFVNCLSVLLLYSLKRPNLSRTPEKSFRYLFVNTIDCSIFVIL